MPRRDDDLFDTQSIVPDTDDRAGHIPMPRTNASQPRNTTSNSSPSFIKQAFIVLMLIALTATCGLFHYQNTQQQMLNAKLQIRLEALESQLGVTASAATQTSETLGEKVKALDGRLATANTEIGKLWAVTNEKNRKTLDEHEKTLASLQAATADLKKTAAEAIKIANEGKQAADSTNRSIAESSSSISTLQQRITQGEQQVRDASQQATLAQDQSEQLQAKLEALNKKIADHEESIRSIDSFRRSVNNDLGKLKQELIGPSSAPMVQ